jgi:RNase P subunit RPR2
MIMELIDKKLLDDCIARYKLSSTIPNDAMNELCSSCGNILVPIRLDQSPNKGAGVMFPEDKFNFHGCPNCNTVLYDEKELYEYARQKTSLVAFLAGIFGIE